MPYSLCLITRKRWDRLAKFLKPDKLSTSSGDQKLEDAAAQAEAPPVLQVLQGHVCPEGEQQYADVCWRMLAYADAR